MNSKKKKRWKQQQPKHERYIIPLSDGFIVIVEYWWQKGKVTRLATPLIRLRDGENGSDEICRYDTAHDFAHLDILDHQRRVINKVAIIGSPSYKKAIAYAIHDLKENHQKYWQDYVNRQKKSGHQAGDPEKSFSHKWQRPSQPR